MNATFDRTWVEHHGLTQTICSHTHGLAPSTGKPDARTTIVWHTLRTKETAGVCTLCNRIIRENDFDYWLLRSRPSLSWGSSDNGTNPANENFGAPFVERPETDLDKLSDAEIKFLFEGVRAYRKAQKVLEQHFGSEVWSVR